MESESPIQQDQSVIKVDPNPVTTETKLETTSIVDPKLKKKLDKLADNILKKSSASTLEEKYYALIQKFVQEQEQTKSLQLATKELEKTIVNLNKLRDLGQADYNKSLLAKDRLESLCRELQKHNKLIKDENLLRIKEEEEKRKEITAKFQLAIDEINKQVSENTEKNNSLIQENAQLAGKLKNLLEQYEVREQHVEKVLKHKDLENQLADAKFQQSELKLKELTERNLNEKKIFENHSNELIKKCEFHQESEKQLKAQLSMYTEKYEEFQTTLKKSNQVFESFKAEMDKMTKKIKKLEQETSQWKNKWEACDKTLQNVVKMKDENEEKSKKLQAKSDAFEKISRALQTERNLLKDQLKAYEKEHEKTEVAQEVVTENKVEPNEASQQGVTESQSDKVENSENKSEQIETIQEAVQESQVDQNDSEKEAVSNNVE